jgi:hypothetical protein
VLWAKQREEYERAFEEAEAEEARAASSILAKGVGGRGRRGPDRGGLRAATATPPTPSSSRASGGAGPSRPRPGAAPRPSSSTATSSGASWTPSARPPPRPWPACAADSWASWARWEALELALQRPELGRVLEGQRRHHGVHHLPHLQPHVDHGVGLRPVRRLLRARHRRRPRVARRGNHKNQPDYPTTSAEISRQLDTEDLGDSDSEADADAFGAKWAASQPTAGGAFRIPPVKIRGI